ncbi:MAG: MobF family relaxase [Acidimicrobiia bacterium]
MLVKVTPLGTITGKPGEAARKVVDYHLGKATASRPGIENANADAAGARAYYADSLEGPGRWIGRGAPTLGLKPGEIVEPAAFEAVLLGRHPHLGAQLLSAQGSAARKHRAEVSTPDAGAWLSVAEAAETLGVDASYVRRLLRRGHDALARRAGEFLTGTALSNAPRAFLLGRHDPGTGEWRVPAAEIDRFARHRRSPRAVIGYDLQFSAPKSVSILWATGTPAERAEIEAAVDAAVEKGVSYLDSIARTRPREADTRGLTAAAFRHATSRNLDPQLHVHVVIANMVETADGRMRALDGRDLYLHAKTAGHLAGAELRHQLTSRLGVRWREVVHGLADIEGVPPEAIAAVSTRKHEIDAAAARAGVYSAAGRQVAAYRTRSAKADTVDPAALRGDWRHHLAVAGFDASARAACVGIQADGPVPLTPMCRAQLASNLAGPDGVTEQHAIFDRRDVIEAVAEWSGDRLAADAVLDAADRFLASPRTVRLEQPPPTGHGHVANVQACLPQPFTTPAILRAEEAVLTGFAAGLHRRRAVVPSEHVDAALAARPSLGEDQAAMVRAICTSGYQFQCVLGAAGSGKTFALEAARDAWERSGYTVLGAAEQGTAAEVLGRGAGLQAETLEYWLTYLDHARAPQDAGFGPRTVLLVDEASTIGTRNLARLVRHAQASGTAVRLVGDPAQHSAVTAGGAFRALVDRYRDRTPQLWELRRQAAPDLGEVRLALRDYREGHVAAALARLAADERVVEADTADELLDKLAADWFTDRLLAADDPLAAPASMIAEHHRERRELNRRARALLLADGTLHGPTLDVAGQQFQAGDEVICRTPARDLKAPGSARGVRNGTRGRIVEVRPPKGRQAGSLLVNFERRGPIKVPASFLTRRVRPGVVGGLTHAYALTSHAAQGDTYDAARTLATDTSTQPGVYVGLSRGRRDVRIYLVRRRDLDDAELSEDEHLPRLTEQKSTLESVVNRLGTAAHEHMALATDENAAAVADLQSRYDLRGLLDLEPAPDADETTLRRAIAGSATALGEAACLDPPPNLLARLGARPSAGPERADWDRAVAMNAVVSALGGLDEPAHQCARHFGLPDADRVARATIDAEVASLAIRPTAELAAERYDLRLALTTAERSSPTSLRFARDCLAGADAALARAQAAVDAARGRVERLSGHSHHRKEYTAASRELAEVNAALIERSRERERAREHVGIYEDRPDPAEARLAQLETALSTQIAQAVQRHRLAPPAYISELLCERPAGKEPAEWDDRVTKLETFRHHRGLAAGEPASSDPNAPPLEVALGPRPPVAADGVAWSALAADLAAPVRRQADPQIAG